MRTAPIILLLCLQMLALGHAVAKHGQPKTGKHDFGSSLLAIVLADAILFWGGWFDRLLGP